MISKSGTLKVGSKTPCPVCGADFGYYAEFGNEIECEICQTTFAISIRTEYDYLIMKIRGDTYETLSEIRKA